MAQNGPKMVPTWSQNGPKSVPRWSQDAPRRPQKTTETRKRKKLGPKRRHPGNKVTSWEPSWTPSWPILDKFWRLFVNMFAKRFLHRFLMVFGRLRTFIFWFSLRRKHNFDIFVKVLVGIVFDTQNPPKIVQKMVPRGVQEALERLQKNIQKKVFPFTQTGPYDHARGLPDSPPSRAQF